MFHGSIYAYSDRTYKILFATLLIESILMLVSSGIDFRLTIDNERWILYQYESTKYVFCVNNEHLFVVTLTVPLELQIDSALALLHVL